MRSPSQRAYVSGWSVDKRALLFLQILNVPFNKENLFAQFLLLFLFYLYFSLNSFFLYFPCLTEMLCMKNLLVDVMCQSFNI